MLAWAHPALREIVWSRRRETVWLSLCLVFVALAIGWLTMHGMTSFDFRGHNLWKVTDLTNPLPIMMWIYWLWNGFHFGMQNFGLMRLLGCPLGREETRIIVGGGTLLALTISPHVLPWLAVFILSEVLISAGHWITEIYLTTKVSPRPLLFLGALLVIGPVAFTFWRPTPHGLVTIAPIIYCGKIGLGFAHFLYDRCIWKMSDPQVRNVIAPALGLSIVHEHPVPEQ
jgi:hypothetical protein